MQNVLTSNFCIDAKTICGQPERVTIGEVGNGYFTKLASDLESTGARRSRAPTMLWNPTKFFLIIAARLSHAAASVEATAVAALAGSFPSV